MLHLMWRWGVFVHSYSSFIVWQGFSLCTCCGAGGTAIPCSLRLVNIFVSKKHQNNRHIYIRNEIV